MKVRYTGETNPVCLIHGKEYAVVGIEMGLYRVIDEEGIDPDDDVPGYLYDPAAFEIVNGSEDEFEDPFADEEPISLLTDNEEAAYIIEQDEGKPPS